MAKETRIAGWFVCAALVLLPALLGIRAGDRVEAFGSSETALIAQKRFNHTLQAAYLTLAHIESQEMSDWSGSHHFTLKALQVERGNIPGPEALGNWRLAPAHRTALIHARARLVKSLKNGMILTAPSALAEAQASFDCWIERQADEASARNTALCRNKFEQAIARVKARQLAQLNR